MYHRSEFHHCAQWIRQEFDDLVDYFTRQNFNGRLMFEDLINGHLLTWNKYTITLCKKKDYYPRRDD